MQYIYTSSLIPRLPAFHSNNKMNFNKIMVTEKKKRKAGSLVVNVTCAVAIFGKKNERGWHKPQKNLTS